MRTTLFAVLVVITSPMIMFAQTQPSPPTTEPTVSDPQSQIAALQTENQQLRQQLDSALAQIKDLKKQIADAAANLNRDDIFVGESEADMLAFIRSHGGGIAVLTDTGTFKRCRVTFVQGIAYDRVSPRGREYTPAVMVHKVVTIEGGQISTILPAAD